MPLFSRFKNRGVQPASKKVGGGENGSPVAPSPVKWQSRWESSTIVPDEVVELVHLCTAEMKSRADALDAPFMLLPFRPDSDPQGARTFIRNFYKSNAERSLQYRGDSLKQELRLTDSLVLCSIMKWCWSRIPNGVVSWPVYDGFRMGEQEAKMARNAFDTFIPIGSESEARKSIIVDFYDLLAAVASHGKMNGHGGRKLSRLAGWWAFDHSDGGNGFEGGYKSWTTAADASSHLFFAYLRSLSPDTDPSMNVIERIPRSLQALVASTEYPPETPSLMQRSTPRMVMLVDAVSPTPFSLLRRARHFEYRDRDHSLRAFSEFEDPTDALTEECKRVLYAVSSTNAQTTVRSRQGLSKPDESWSSFQNLGFSDIDEKALSQKSPTSMGGSTNTVGHGLRSESRSKTVDVGRPTTPSWADFLSSGFADDGGPKSPALLYPPAQVLPPLGSSSSSQALGAGDEDLAPGELAAITNVELDDAFWWVWMTSLAGEEPSERKAVFGRCALIETTVANRAWLIIEEQVKGASPDPMEGAYIAPKKSLFSFTKRGRLGRKRSMVSKNSMLNEPPPRALSATPSKVSITTDQHAKIKAAARALTRKQEHQELESTRRGRHDEGATSKTNSMLTLGIQSEAGPAMKWASSYDKNAIRRQYLGDSEAGKGISREDLSRNISSTTINGNATKPQASPVPPAVSAAKPEQLPERELQSVPAETPAVAAPVPMSSTHDSEPEAIQEPSTTDFSSRLVSDEPTYPTYEAKPTLPETNQQMMNSFDKEVAVSTASSPSSPRLGRKPVPQADDHPAHRTQGADAPKPSTPVTNPAALAAQKAMQAKTGDAQSPESTRSDNKIKKQGASQGGFRKLFGKKDATRGESSNDMQHPEGNGLAPPVEQSFGRRLSLMRKKNGNSSASKANEPKMANAPAAAAMPVAPNYAMANKSQKSIGEREAAEHEFSRFDQGPIADMPSAAPVESEGKPSPIPDKHSFDHDNFVNNHEPAYTEPVAEADRFASPAFPARQAEDAQSETTMDEETDHHDAQVVKDRWATIRENAHKRAERQRQSEDQSTQSRPSRLTDDGETSGEETIESRVARIKARVAELTGNMDSASARH